MAKRTVQQTTLPDLGQFADDACRVCGAKPQHFALPVSTFDPKTGFLRSSADTAISKRTRINHDAVKHGWTK